MLNAPLPFKYEKSLAPTATKPLIPLAASAWLAVRVAPPQVFEGPEIVVVPLPVWVARFETPMFEVDCLQKRPPPPYSWTWTVPDDLVNVVFPADVPHFQ